MQIKVFTIPIASPETMEEEANRFLRGHRVMTVDRQFTPDGGDCNDMGTTALAAALGSDGHAYPADARTKLCTLKGILFQAVKEIFT